MKWIVVFLLLLDPVALVEGKLWVTEFGQFTLRLDFPSSFSGLTKSCGRLFPVLYLPLLDSSGFTHDTLRGRVTQTETATSIEFKISHARLQDTGYYRCYVHTLYQDYHVRVIASPYHRNPAQKTAVPVSFTEPAQAHEDHSSRVGWSPHWTLVAVVSVAVTLVAVSLGSVVCVLARRRRRSKEGGDYPRTTSRMFLQSVIFSSAVDTPKDTPAVVYATVDFKPKQPELHPDLRTEDESCESWLGERDVAEYSTVAVHHRQTTNC
ncbi:uncharacterized protein LOC128749972 isoform X2 [Synchiropus splendidus]|uniref:uncharacterized protein LOC128749972 isoform X2 n=1 Tax=Synchiropus splendidus TaxID=270530 RepID=UPI00237DE211|nr:uncharacterized protein LOC128749972 isoform X2 [Synchiropus splendidus]